MAEHWNIQINIQRVTVDEGTRSVGIVAGKEPRKEVTEVLKLAITADTEVGAYEKAQRMLTANHPDVTVIPAGQSYRPPVYPPGVRAVRDNPQA